MAKYTPGPWIADDIGTNDDATVRISAYDGTDTYYHRCMALAECWVRDDENDKDSPHVLQAEANARLMAAAPELFECLCDAVDRMLGSSPAITKLRERSLAAIAKAQGSPQAHDGSHTP